MATDALNALKEIYGQMGSLSNLTFNVDQSQPQQQAQQQQFGNQWIGSGIGGASGMAYLHGSQQATLAGLRHNVMRCKNENCDTDYNKMAFKECPSCGIPWSEKEREEKAAREPVVCPDLREYESRVSTFGYYGPSKTGGTLKKESEKMGLLSVWTKKRELELELRKRTEDLDHHKRQEEMRIAEAVQKQRLLSNEEISKTKLATDKKIADAEAAHQAAITKLKGEHQTAVSTLYATHAKEKADLEAKFAREHYEKLSEAMTKLHQEGDKNSQFIQNLSLEMVRKTPRMLPTHAEVHVSGDLKDLDKA